MVFGLVVAIVLVWSIPESHAQAPTRVTLDIRNSVLTTSAVLAGALREAGAIWAPYGVCIGAATQKRRDADEDGAAVVPVTVELSRKRKEMPPDLTPLGWTGFTRTGDPTMRIWIFQDAIARVAGSGVLYGRRDEQSSLILEERLLARILGRTLAHEVGHVLLRTADHSPTGLMRASQSVVELQHPSKAGFALAPPDLARLGTTLPAVVAVTGSRH